MAPLATLLTGGRPGRSRVPMWLGNLFKSFLLHPIRTLRLLHPFGWARESVIFLCMQTLEGYINMRLHRRWWWPFGKVLGTQGNKVPAFIPQANEFAKKAAALIGGTPMSMVTEVLLNVPGTAHILGGCPMAASAEDGVVDDHNRAFGYKNMYVCDGSVLASNLGVNPSLTICAVTERAMSFIPPANDADWQDAALREAVDSVEKG
jgi:cholesterol oxidase